MAYFDLDELPSIQSRLISNDRRAALSFQVDDHIPRDSAAAPAVHPLREEGSPLDEDAMESATQLSRAVRRLVAGRTGFEPTGPIRLLTQLRFFGYYFSPLNLFYCFDRKGCEVECVIAAVSNTPWDERHQYVLWEGNRTPAALPHRYEHPKAFHVSPFMDMEMQYLWRLNVPTTTLRVGINNRTPTGVLFQAGMHLNRVPLRRDTLRRLAIRYPIMTSRIMIAIHYQALRLWIKRCPFYPHPKTKEAQPVEVS